MGPSPTVFVIEASISNPTCPGHHGRQQFGGDAASPLHHALLAVRQVGHHSNDLAGGGCLAGVAHDQELHNAIVHWRHFTMRSNSSYKCNSTSIYNIYKYKWVTVPVSCLNDEDILASDGLQDVDVCFVAAIITHFRFGHWHPNTPENVPSYHIAQI